MTDTKYNGWTNYETWAVKLWMDNDEGSDSYWREQAQEHWDNAEATAVWTREESARYALADTLKDQHEENNPCEESNNVYTDLMRAALSEVNWSEIAENLLDGVDREVEPKKKEETMTPADLRAIRESLALSHAALAAKLGVHRTSVTRWEAGELPIDARTAMAVAHLTCKPRRKKTA